jgi:hypothetical protein
MGEKTGGNCPPVGKIEGGPPFLALNLRKKQLFYFSMEAYIYIVHSAKGIRMFGHGYALKP